ncbi:hypothetical protein A5780_37815 [Nocardia sp. 852002-20019_SCH5090214]|jgi:hypothetical protein|uniref:Uncharacterized protein n=2 Tax=Nocardia TaxID=1817 RepID=A0A231H0T3_9NOCA|nr:MULTISPECIES: hypothetical protein [Nocardia]OBA44394.1 hypothetical protein A5780_37815 [Nocardia sp. 852002-20019_SCH5090214]OXR42453.1 hypothetical protein B7C42_05655 [Nocardia cerradoensis]
MSKNARPNTDPNVAALRAALAADPGATASALAFTAGMSVSTARNILGRMADDGTATRITDPDKPNGAHRWTLATPAPAKRAGRTERAPRATKKAATAAPAAPAAPAKKPAAARKSRKAAPADTGNGEAPLEKLPSGGLRGMVEDFMRDNPGKSVSPTAVKNALDEIHAPRTLSSGAINNALEKLTADGVTVRTCDAPKRWALAADA